jgi:3-hydroxyacyl-[acyl-carrier-protein] dehydratase
MATIQHRYPFLLVDRILELEPGVRAVGLKNVTRNEWFFNGHYPDYPIMPSMLIVEHTAQVGCALLLSCPGYEGKLGVFAGIEGLEFLRPIVPGDQLVSEVILQRLSGRAGKIQVTTRVGNEVIMTGKCTFLLIPDPTHQPALVAP